MTRQQTQAWWASGGVAPDRPLQTGDLLFVPQKIWVEGGNLVSDLNFGFRKKPRPGAGMVDSFVRLHESPDAAIVQFARRWGTLNLCKHGLPFFHRITNDVFPDGPLSPPNRECPVLKKSTSVWAEPLSVWRKLSAVAHAILSIGAELNQNRIGGGNDWAIANIEYLHGADPGLTGKPSDLARARDRLGSLVEDWIGIGGIAPQFKWSVDRQQWEIALGSQYGTPFGAIGLALIMAVSEKDGLAICSACHKSYIPPRRPDPTRRNYCAQCGIRAAWRDAAREKRQRQREGAKRRDL